MDKKTLVKELATKVRKYKIKARTVDVDFSNIGDKVFVYGKDETLFNPKYFKLEDYFILKAFDAFLKCHQELTNEEVLEIISSKKKEFEYLQNFNAETPSFLADIRAYGAKSFVIAYISDMVYGKKDEEGLSV